MFFDINNLERNKNEATPERYAFDNAKGFSQTGVASKLNIPQAKNEVNGVTASEQYPLLYTEYLKSKGQLPTNRMLYTERLLKQAEKSGDIYTQRILQSEIEKAKKNFELEASNDADVNTIARLSQNEEDVRPPVEYDGDFEEFLDLNISNDEGKALSAVWKESRKSGFEYGIVIEGGEIRDLVTSNMANTVGVDLENYGYGLTLLHSHTNATPFSIADFRMLLNEKVDRIGVVGYNGDAFVAYIGYGDRPMLEEFEEAARKIRREVDLEIPNYTNFYDWTLAERNYMAIREQAFRIARYFGWTLEGGRLDVE